MSDREASELVTIRQFGNISEALLAQGCLESAGIESFLADMHVARLDWPVSRGIRLQVEAEDVETAVGVLRDAAAEAPVP